MKTTKNTLTSYFEADHERLDSLFQSYRRMRSKDAAEAKPYFREFFKGLKRHIVWEEDVLFPFLEKGTGVTAGPTEVMRQEHREIGALLRRIHDKVRQGDTLDNEDEDTLIDILTAHNQKEEDLLYPAIDQILKEGEAAKIFLAMECIPAERFASCCGNH